MPVSICLPSLCRKKKNSVKRIQSIVAVEPGKFGRQGALVAEQNAGRHLPARNAGATNRPATAMNAARRWWRRTVRAYRRSLYPETDLHVQLVGAQVRMVRDATHSLVYILPFASLLVAWANSQWIATPVLAAWCAAITASAIAFETIYRRTERSAGNDAAGVGRRARTFFALGVVQSAIWASMGIVLWAPDQPVNHMLLILILASTISGWCAIGSMHLAIGRAPIVCYAIGMIAMPLFANDTLDHALAGMCLAFTVVMVIYARTTFETTRRMLSLQFERTGLIANLKRAKKDSDEARHRAESASLAKSQFLANMSHELRTPMNAILGFSEIISSKALGAAVDKYAEYAALIHNSGQQLLGLINDILDLAKLEAGHMELREEPVDLPSLALDAARSMSPRATAAQLALETHMPVNLPLLRADERALQQILMNLLSNAIKFTPPGGRVTIFAELAGSGLMFGVEDTGVGIAEDDLERVFESFGQGRHDITTYEKGTGLGLPIVKGLAEAHGGHVALLSRKDEGTRVTVYLPGERLMTRPKTQLISTGLPSVMSRGWGG